MGRGYRCCPFLYKYYYSKCVCVCVFVYILNFQTHMTIGKGVSLLISSLENLRSIHNTKTESGSCKYALGHCQRKFFLGKKKNSAHI